MQIPRLHKETSLFDRAKSIAATFEVLSNSITSLVQGEATYDAPDGTIKTNTVGTMIRQTMNNVLIRATSSDTTAAQGGQHLIQSLINVAPEGVRIAASKLEITGAAVFSAINGDTGTTKIDGGKIDATSITIGQSQVTGLTSALDGKVTGVNVEYAHNQSTSTPPTSGWSDTCPEWQEGWHIWQRTATTAGGTTTYSDPACISGREPRDGVTVSAVEYAVGTGNTPPSSGWGTTIPSVSQGQWLWTRVTYSDGSTVLSPAYQGTDGTDGEDGSDGLGISTSTITYGTSASASTEPSSWQASVPTVTKGQWLWTRTVTTYTDGTSSTTYSKSYAGTDGSSGTSVTVSAIEYGTSTDGTTQPASWQSAIPTVSQGQWLWTRTSYTDGTSAVTKAYAGTDGATGADGTSVTILGSYNTLAELQVAHPTGSLGDSYIVSGDLYVWDGSAWSNVGQIQGPQGPAGTDGTSVTVSSVMYGVSTSASTQPTWSPTVPTSITKGRWLWVKTTYSDSTETITKSYVGTDGQDGKSVYVQSATKSGDTTTVVLSDGTTQTTLTISDGEDGTNGTNGLGGYVHTAWANSADGTSGFSTTVSANKLYLGVYTDHSATDSTTPSDYSWSLIKGANGTSVTVSKIEYGVSTSASTEPTSWNTTAPTSIAKGRWLWVKTTYSTGSTAVTKSYVGTDGEDGTSVYVQSATKSGGTTTLVIANSDGSTDTITINDGEDGANGTSGRDGQSAYVHVAWATSADGSQGFSPTVSTDKTYIGVYTDNVAADSTTPSDYSWSLIKGADGTSVTVSRIEYGTSASASTNPSAWRTTPPTSITKGQWLWVRTTYSTGNTTTTKSYVGTDGQDGTSVFVRSATKSGDTTTVVIEDSDGHTNTLTIKDGEDGATGAPGANGLSGYVHVAWATSADGSEGFSTTVSAGKTYLGTYTDNTQADSQTYSDYSWSLIKGADGESVTVTKTEYGINTSASAEPTWSTTVPTSITKGRWLWVKTTYSDGSTTVTKSYVGTDGTNGADGTSITVTKTEYGVSTSASTEPTWSTTVPTSIAKGRWLWTRTTYSDGNTTITKSYVGTDGTNGTNGADGTGITSIVEQYYLSTSNTTQTGGSWSSNQPAWQSGRYIWTRSQITWDTTPATVTTTTPVLAQALNGANSTASSANATATEAAKRTYVSIRVAAIDYDANTATLQATLFIDGAAKTSGVTYAWLKDGSAISGATARTYSVPASNGLDHAYSCKCTW